jgi:hypothetical protein
MDSSDFFLGFFIFITAISAYSKSDRLEKEIDFLKKENSIIKTVLVMKNIMPAELQKTE